jgi:hypothetical protein
VREAAAAKEELARFESFASLFFLVGTFGAYSLGAYSSAFVCSFCSFGCYAAAGSAALFTTRLTVTL